MAQGKSQDRRMVRNRRGMIYTFLIILTLFYISAHRKLERERAVEAAKVTEAVGAGTVSAVDGEGAAGDGLGVGKGYRVDGDFGLDGGSADDRMHLGGQTDAGTNHSGGMEGAKELFISQDDMWCLILTNAEYPVPEDYAAELKAIPGTEQSVDERIYEPLMQMLEDMKAQGLSPVVCSGYRTLDKQEKLFNRKVQSYVNKYHKLEKEFEKTPESQWLMENAQDYGFIMRYGEDKVDITGIEYEPWHYRYVGVEAARYMKEHGLSLEEFYIEQSLYG